MRYFDIALHKKVFFLETTKIMKMFDVLSSKNGKSDGLFLSVDVIYGQCAYLEEKWEKSGPPKKTFLLRHYYSQKCPTFSSKTTNNFMYVI